MQMSFFWLRFVFSLILLVFCLRHAAENLLLSLSGRYWLPRWTKTKCYWNFAEGS